MTLRRFLLPCALSLPAVAWGAAAHLQTRARDLGVELRADLALLAPAAPAAPAPGSLVQESVEAWTAPDDPPSPELALAEAPRRGAHRKPRGRHEAPTAHTVFVSEHTVLRLARAGIVPSGRPIAARGTRPAGIELSGVAPLGIGLREGDVLTEVTGRAVQTEDQVVGIILGALARQVRSISGVFFRGGVRWSLVVEVPLAELPKDAPALALAH
jgi:hypothetical protein